MRRISFNGKFYSGELNGVHRVADRLIRAVDAKLAELAPEVRPDVRLLVPRKRRWTPALDIIRIEEEANGHRQIWEQLVLPWRARHDVLVNLCNLAPVAHFRKILLLHDAQFLFPDNSYPWRRRLGHRFLTPLMMRTSAKPLTVSQYSRSIIDLTGICPRDHVGVLPNGIDHMLDIVSEKTTIGGALVKPGAYVLMFGSEKRYKNISVVLDAFRDDRLATVKLLIIGSSAALLSRAGLTLPANAQMLGAIDDRALRPLYENAICTVMPSRTEGFGLPPLEAMALGCPAVVAPSGAMPEVCADAASYADIDAPEQWVDAILRLRDEPEWREERIAEGLHRAARFTWARSADLLWSDIAQLAGAVPQGVDGGHPASGGPDDFAERSRVSIKDARAVEAISYAD